MLEMNEKFRFSTDFEKDIHKKISSMKYGDCFTMETVLKTKEERKALSKAIIKSASYNCMVVRLHWLKDTNNLKITHEG